MNDRSFFETWKRRIIIIPLYFIAFLVVIATLPLTLPGTIIVDTIRRSRWASLRCLAFLNLYLGAELLGIYVLFAQWIFAGSWLGTTKGKERLVRWTHTTQRWWGGWLFNGTCRIFGIKLDIDEPDGINRGPLLLFIRHASLPDTSLPGALFILRHRIRLRHIIKRELLWDPCLEIGGSRVPTCFVNRGSQDNTKELENIGALAKGMGENIKDGIMIFPEGTRFTPEKRLRIIQKLAEKGDTYFLEKAKSLKNVLPPRLGGSLAILEANTRAYAVFCAHVGFEAATKAMNMLNGSLINQTIRIKLWKVPFDKIPKTREEQIEWLYENWKRIDDWIEAHKNMGSNLIEQSIEESIAI